MILRIQHIMNIVGVDIAILVVALIPYQKQEMRSWWLLSCIFFYQSSHVVSWSYSRMDSFNRV
jgi:hypothetical protein